MGKGADLAGLHAGKHGTSCAADPSASLFFTAARPRKTDPKLELSLITCPSLVSLRRFCKKYAATQKTELEEQIASIEDQ